MNGKLPEEAVVPSPPAWAEAEADPHPASVPLLRRLAGRLLLALGDRVWGCPHPLAGRDLETLSRREARFFREAWDAYAGEDLPLHGKRVLDLACGRGAKTAEVGRLGASFVVGVDQEMAMLKTTRAALKRAGVRGAVVRADASRLPFRNGAFPAVLSVDTVEHLHDLRGAMAELGRMLPPGGRAYIAFGPYASALGSHLNNYSTLPWCHLLVPRPLLIERIRVLTARLAAAAEPGEADELRHVAAWERYHFTHCLPRVTLRRFGAAAAQAGLGTLRLFRMGSWWLRPLLYVPGWADHLVREQFVVLHKGAGGAPLREAIVRDLRRVRDGLAKRLRRLG